MKSLAPILLFVFNRPTHTKRVLQSLAANSEAKESTLIVYADGARNASEQLLADEVRSIVQTVQGFASVQLVARDSNWGLARNVIDGVTTQIERYGRVIVLEDDLEVAPYFLRFMNDALEVYKEEERVGHIQACDYTNDPALPETFLIKWTGSWGWATWKRAWKHFNPDGKVLLDELEARKLTHRFDFDGSYGYTRMLRRQIAGVNNSWAIRWNASLFLKDILSLNVGRSLVRNTGFDGSGTHCGGDKLYEATLYPYPIEVRKADSIVENESARNCLRRYYHRTNNFWAKAFRRIKRTLRGDFGA